MAEQTLEANREASLSTPAVAAPSARPSHLDTAEALRQARYCLENADRRLRRGDAKQTDEILRLLQNATDLLECALFTEPRATD